MSEQDRTNNAEQPRKFVDRRKKNDWIVRSITIITVIGWLGAVVALLLIDWASPIRDNIFTRFLNISVAGYWNSARLHIAFFASLGSFMVSALGLIFNVARHRRKTDKYNKLLITICVASTLLLVFFVIAFSGA